MEKVRMCWESEARCCIYFSDAFDFGDDEDFGQIELTNLVSPTISNQNSKVGCN